jgi:hypothetical protein
MNVRCQGSSVILKRYVELLTGRKLNGQRVTTPPYIKRFEKHSHVLKEIDFLRWRWRWRYLGTLTLSRDGRELKRRAYKQMGETAPPEELTSSFFPKQGKLLTFSGTDL